MALAYVGKIISVDPIENADKLESVTVVCGSGGKWQAVVGKGDFREGDKCRIFLQDAVLPPSDDYKFMERNKWRVKIMRLRGARSEALVLPVTDAESRLSIGDSIEELYGITKYEKPTEYAVSGGIKGSFPSFIPKTDEPNFQTVPDMLETIRNNDIPVYITTKADGSSATYYHVNDGGNGVFGACSRNVELDESKGGIIWELAKKYKIKEKLEEIGRDIAIQGEVVGPKIQGNPMGLKEPDILLFNAFDIKKRKYFDINLLFSISRRIGVKTVQLNSMYAKLPETDEELVKLAEGTYPNGRQREGIVVRPVEEKLFASVFSKFSGGRMSFKVINPLYKD